MFTYHFVSFRFCGLTTHALIKVNPFEETCRINHQRWLWLLCSEESKRNVRCKQHMSSFSNGCFSCSLVLLLQWMPFGLISSIEFCISEASLWVYTTSRLCSVICRRTRCGQRSTCSSCGQSRVELNEWGTENDLRSSSSSMSILRNTRTSTCELWNYE